MRWLDGRRLDAVFHLGAISETTATDGDLVIEDRLRLWLPIARLVHVDHDAFHLCLVGVNLRRWRCRAFAMINRCAALHGTPADRSLRLEQTPVRHGRRGAAPPKVVLCRRNGLV